MLNKISELENKKTMLTEKYNEISEKRTQIDKTKYKISEYPAIFYKFIVAGVVGLLSCIFLFTGLSLPEGISKIVMLSCGMGISVATAMPLTVGIKQLINDKNQWKNNKQKLVNKYSLEMMETKNNINEVDIQIKEIERKILQKNRFEKGKKLPLKRILNEADKDELDLNQPNI